MKVYFKSLGIFLVPLQTKFFLYTQSVVYQEQGKYHAEEVTVQCDASEYGLGAALLQNGQPVAFASRSSS